MPSSGPSNHLDIFQLKASDRYRTFLILKYLILEYCVLYLLFLLISFGESNKELIDNFVKTFIQHSSGDPSHGNQTTQRNKRHPDWQGRSQTVFADDMILYIKKPEESTPKLLYLISEFSKVA